MLFNVHDLAFVKHEHVQREQKNNKENKPNPKCRTNFHVM